MTDDTKPAREFWIEFGGDPSDDKEVYKRYCAATPFKPAGFSEEVIHTIEFSAYQDLKQKYDELLSYLPKIPTEPHERVMVKKRTMGLEAERVGLLQLIAGLWRN